MKKRFEYRKEFERLLTETGIDGKTRLQEHNGKVQLINAQRRVIKSMMKLHKSQQLTALALLKQDAEKRHLDNLALENG